MDTKIEEFVNGVATEQGTRLFNLFSEYEGFNEWCGHNNRFGANQELIKDTIIRHFKTALLSLNNSTVVEQFSKNQKLMEKIAKNIREEQKLKIRLGWEQIQKDNPLSLEWETDYRDIIPKRMKLLEDLFE